jgi:radical SAM protein with 4Fe4S-binding SPASM domain
MKTKDIYININNGLLYVFQSQGLLVSNKIATKISKDIATVLQYCNGNLSLKESLYQHKQNKPSANLYLILSGIAELSIEQKLLAKEIPWDIPFHVIDEEDVFYPQSLHIELTAKCNLQCLYCYRKSHINIIEEDRLSVEELKNIIISLADRGLKIVELTGGEPLLHPHFMDIVDICYKNLSLMSIITNAVLIDNKFVEQILPYKNKVLFSISLDSHLEKEHDRRCGMKGAFKKTVKGIKLLAEQGFIVRTAMAVDENNWSQIENTLLFSKSIGATKFSYSPIIPFGRAEKNYSFWKNITVEEVKNKDKHLKDNYSDFIHHLDKEMMQQVYEKCNCGAGHISFAMNPSGDIRICATSDVEAGEIGSLKSMSPYDIFKSEICHLSSKLEPPKPAICGNCQHMFFCMGCALRGSKGVSLIGIENCKWAKHEDVKRWLKLIEKSTKK